MFCRMIFARSTSKKRAFETVVIFTAGLFVLKFGASFFFFFERFILILKGWWGKRLKSRIFFFSLELRQVKQQSFSLIIWEHTRNARGTQSCACSSPRPQASAKHRIKAWCLCYVFVPVPFSLGRLLVSADQDVILSSSSCLACLILL